MPYTCPRCQGCWEDDPEDPRCLNCGHREQLKEAIVNRMGRPKGWKKGIPYSAYRQSPKKNTTTTPVHSHREVEITDQPIDNADVLTIDETNPFLQVLAEEWEALEEEIAQKRALQSYLKELVEKCQERINGATVT